jgi:hypothetical protein
MSFSINSLEGKNSIPSNGNLASFCIECSSFLSPIPIILPVTLISKSFTLLSGMKETLSISSDNPM